MWISGSWYHKNRQTLWGAPSMVMKPPISWEHCLLDTASRCPWLWLGSSCLLVSKGTHDIWKYPSFVVFSSIGSTVIIVSALTAIAQQLLSDCQLYGIEALSSNQASEWFVLWVTPASWIGSFLCSCHLASWRKPWNFIRQGWWFARLSSWLVKRYCLWGPDQCLYFSEAVLIWCAGSKLVAGLSACTARQKANCCNWRGSSEKYLFLFKTLFVMLKFYAPAGSWPRGWVVRISGTLWHLHLAMVDSCNQSSVQKFLMSLWNTLISNFKQVSPSVSLHEWVVLAQNLRYYTFKCLLTPCWSTQQILTRLSWFSYTRHWPASDPGVLQGSFQAECVPAGAECRQDIDKVSKSYLIIRSNSFVTCPTNFSNFDRTCGFLYLFALSGKKIQVFCRSTDLVWRVGVYLKSIGNWILKFSDVRGLAEGTSWRKWVLFHQSEKVGWQQHTSTEEKDDGRLQIWVRLHTKIIRWTIWNMYQICDYLKYVSDMSRCCFVQRLPQWEFTVLTSVLVYHSVGKMCLSFYI